VSFQEFQASARKINNDWHYDFPNPPHPAIITDLGGGDWETIDGTYSGTSRAFVEWVLYGYLCGNLKLEDREKEGDT
jgi:hypothetical protein